MEDFKHLPINYHIVTAGGMIIGSTWLLCDAEKFAASVEDWEVKIWSIDGKQFIDTRK